MNAQRKIEIFSAGCQTCEDAIALVRRMACPSCEIEVLDMQQEKVVLKAKQYGVHRIPAIVVNGKLADCCNSQPLDEVKLQALGIGTPL